MARKKGINLPLIEVLTASFVFHVVLLMMVGGITIYNYVQKDDTPFDSPPPMEAIQPTELEYQVKMKERQTSSAQPTQRKLTVNQITNITPPTFDLDVAPVNPNLALGANADSSLSDGLGSDVGGRTLGFGVSQVDFFGIKDNGQNIVFIVDVAKSMLEPERGDVAGFTRVKEELKNMINNLSPGTLFNVYTFENDLDVFSAKPRRATDENKAAAGNWIDQYWSFQGNQITGRKGTRLRNYTPDMTGIPIQTRRIQEVKDEDGDVASIKLVDGNARAQQIGHGSSRMDLALLAAFENRADAIFMITDGTPDVEKAWTDENFKDYQRDIERWARNRANYRESRSFKDHQEAMAEFRRKIQKCQDDRRKRGLPPEIREGGYPCGLQRPREPSGIERKPWRDPHFNKEELVDLIKGKARNIYRNQVPKQDMPPVHIVGYSVNQQVEDFFDDLQRPFPGSQTRTIGGRELIEKFEKEQEAANEDA